MRSRISPAVAISLVALFFSLTGAGFAFAATSSTTSWIYAPRVHPHVRDCRVFDYKPAPLEVVGGPSEGEWFAIAAITCKHSTWPHIALRVCVQRLELARWRTLRCKTAKRPDVGTPDYLTTDAGSFRGHQRSRYREKLHVRVGHRTRTFYGPSSYAL